MRRGRARVVIPTIGIIAGFFDWRLKRTSRAAGKQETAYDYIIVGAGSSGCALAARLSEDPKCSVLLLEEGLDFRSADGPPAMRSQNPIGMVMPAYYPQFQFPTLEARRSPTQNPKLYWRGRGIGGSSLINGQIAIRPTPEDFQEWQAQGCAGWGWADVLPCFKRLEDDPLAKLLPAHHGLGGPVPINRNPLWQWGTVDLSFLQAALETGYSWKKLGDSNMAGDGLAILPSNSRGGDRITTNDGFIEPIRSRPNLTIRGEALVDRVLLERTPNNKDYKARGVRVRLGGQWEELAAEKEVILCAGAVHTPAILMRSGVGPREELEKHSIPCLVPLPVGRNLQEHPLLGAILRLKPEAQAKSPFERHTNICLRFSTEYPGDAFMVSLNGFGASIGQFLPKSAPVSTMQRAYSEEDHHHHDGEGEEEFYLGDGERGEAEITKESVAAGEWCFMSGRLVEGCPCCEGFDFEASEQPAGLVLPNDPRTLVGRPGLEPLGMLCVWLGKVFSKGTVELASSDPLVHPKVEMNLLGDDRDKTRMAEALKQLVRVCSQPAITDITESIAFDAADTDVKGVKALLEGPSSALDEWMLRNVGDTQHIAGTCEMGPAGAAVVDPSLRVNHVDNLRVADASVMPSVVRANTHLTCVMIGERAAELILKKGE